jgi:purine-binding chemotaxis protein CheW
MPGLSAETLRREFDDAFARPLRELRSEFVDLLAIRVGGQPFAVLLAELAGVASGRRVTLVPSPEPAFSGLVGIRGAVFAVYDLAVLLGLSAQGGERRWVALAAGGDELALAFDELEGHLRLDPAELGVNESARDGFCEHAVRTGSGLRPIVRVARIISTVSERAARERPGKGDGRDG